MTAGVEEDVGDDAAVAAVSKEGGGEPGDAIGAIAALVVAVAPGVVVAATGALLVA